MSVNGKEVLEDLFLDASVWDVLHAPITYPIEPWNTFYVDAIGDNRLGDAILAHYHIFGSAKDGMVTTRSVLKAVRFDAISYKIHEPERYAEAVVFYKNYKDKMTSADTHPELIRAILQVDEQNPSSLWIPWLDSDSE
ncbi:hypothetical protein FAUST_1889 [Fusarium austroamericanum]|uniref:Uncharacterized protein n=1 Tax=Fusarium austroamericanum TaxID=282268 RepID=A0AAN6C7R8_FUSAU|nr:hypothetical protein FAUST_1889 [Fusarium austroamericanum]